MRDARAWLLLALAGSLGCGSSYAATHGPELEGNRAALRELASLIETRPLQFLARLTPLTTDFGHSVHPLGFGYVIEHGAYQYNDQIRFGVTQVRRGSDVLSYGATPFAAVGGAGRTAYQRLFVEAGWKPNDRFGLEPKYHAYEATTAPVGIPRDERRAGLASLMSPFSGNIFATGPGPDPLRDAFAALAPGLDDEGLLYLLHALNPATRALAIRHVRCRGQAPGPAVSAWIEHLLAESPPVRTSYADMDFEKPLPDLVRCPSADR